MMSIEATLERVVAVMREGYGERLLSVVLFGSQAKGDSDRFSDIDLLVIVAGLPADWRERKKHLRAIKSRLNVGRKLEIFLADPEEVRSALANASPLMLEIHDVHHLVYDPRAFFAQEMKRFALNLKSWQARKRAEGVWEVPGLAAR